MNEQYVRKLKKQLEESFLFTPFLGANLTIRDARLGEWHATCGFQDPTSREALASDSQFYIYSITKTFTAVIVLKLVEFGQLSLDDSIQPLVPGLKIDNHITIRQLLNHTAGLPSYTDSEKYMPGVKASPAQPWAEDWVVDLLENKQPDFAPGQGWHYSNTGYFVLKQLIENVTGQSFAEAVDKFIASPLGLSATFAAVDIGSDCLTPGYSRQLHADKRMENIKYKYHPGWCYTGLIVSSTSDTVRFYHALLGGNILAPHLLDELAQPVAIGKKDPRFGNPAYGLGVMIDTSSDYGLLIGHGGDGPGYNPWVMHLPDFHGRALTMAVFANTGYGIIPKFLVNDLLAQLSDG